MLPPKNQFYGHRDVTMSDPFGYTWGAFTVTEEMSAAEMHRRMKGMTEGPEGGKMPGRRPKREKASARFRAASAWLPRIWSRKMARD